MPLRGKAASFFDKLGSGISKTAKNIGSSAVNTFSTGLGKQLGQYALEAAPALLAFKNGGKIPGRKGKAVKIIAHSGEFILPIRVKPTSYQKKEVAKMKKGKFIYN